MPDTNDKKSLLRKFLFAVKLIEVRLRFIIVVVVAGLIIGNWETLRAHWDRWARPARTGETGEAGYEYFCPMHPSVVRAGPALCPICGMPLSRRKVGEKTPLPAGVLNRVTLSPARIQQAGIATHEVGYRRLAREIEAVGVVEVDERRLARITARVAGRVDRLFVDFTGTRVEKGAPLVWLYSPDLVSAQEEFLLALRAARAAAPAAPGSSVLEAARRRLERWGITAEQIERLGERGSAETHVEIVSPASGTVLEKPVLAGQYVMEGTVLYTVADLASVWVLAQVYEDDAGFAGVGQPVEISTVADPGNRLSGTVSFVDPVVQPASRTVRVRLDVPNPEGRLRPGQYVTARLHVPLGKEGAVWWGC